MRSCGWCQTFNPDEAASNCINCGGPLPSLPGVDPGPLPSGPPRAVPFVYQRRHVMGFGFLFGSIFSAVGVVFIGAFCLSAFVMPPMLLGACVGLIFPGIGLPLLVMEVRGGMAKLAALKHGLPTVGEVVHVERSGEGNWVVEYTYEVAGRTLGGRAVSADAAVSRFEPGHGVHVVFLEDDPSVSALWPPLPPAF